MSTNNGTLPGFQDFIAALPLVAGEERVRVDNGKDNAAFRQQYGDLSREELLALSVRPAIMIKEAPSGQVIEQVSAILQGDKKQPATPEQLDKIYGLFLPSVYGKLLETHGKLIPVHKPATPAPDGHFVMCSPEELDSGKVLEDKVLHYAGWENIRRSIINAGGSTDVIDGRQNQNSNRETFTRDPVFILNDTIYVSTRGRDEIYHLEIKQLLEKLKSAKPNLTVKEVDGEFEGGNLIYDKRRDLIFMGVKDADREADKANVAALSTATGKKVVPIIMSKPDEYYHLDTFMAALPSGEIAVYPPATASMDIIAKAITGTAPEKEHSRMLEQYLITLDEKDAKGYATNLTTVGSTAIMPCCRDALEKRLNKAGYTVVSPERLHLPEGSFMLMDGSVHCLTQPTEQRDGKAPAGQAFSKEVRQLLGAMHTGAATGSTHYSGLPAHLKPGVRSP